MKSRRAFTLVEVLVALVLMGVAAAGLVTALSGDHRLRETAVTESIAADLARDHLELLAALPCSGDASGVASFSWGAERWRAQPSRSAWLLTDSLVRRLPAAPIVIEARVACPG